ncbi:MAG: RNA polymerase sigma factor [Sphingobacterium sp.]|uniref:RNA polymerase sigma factor n=1 Tax=Sphingobacterium sp. JB170 TaxID=1434842 RepID=UPI00097F6705|nr:sigma-70 family RNA polymerase sigma factor [Sphingobacterium sp. JB170]SJN44582.1 RNA polymerase ECF-type sigma factor [Sphingobacterium sp. JB170]
MKDNFKSFGEVKELLQLNHGCESSFTAIYHRHQQKIYSNILKIVHSPEYAQEILQDVFLSLWQNRYKIDKDKSVASWLFVVSFNKSMDFLKKKLRDHIDFVEDYDSLYLDVENGHEQDEILRGQLQLLEEAIDKLSPRKKEVFRLHRYEGYSKERVAETLGLSVNSVSEYLKQANKSIKQHIATSNSYAYGNSVLVLACAYIYL